MTRLLNLAYGDFISESKDSKCVCNFGPERKRYPTASNACSTPLAVTQLSKGTVHVYAVPRSFHVNLVHPAERKPRIHTQEKVILRSLVKALPIPNANEAPITIFHDFVHTTVSALKDAFCHILRLCSITFPRLAEHFKQKQYSIQGSAPAQV